MKNNSSNGKLDGSLGAKFPPIPADAEYRKEHQQEEALIDPIDKHNNLNRENNEVPANVSGAEPIPNSVNIDSKDDQTDIYNPKTWQIFHDL